MMMKAISFLGTSQYRPTHYTYAGKQCETEFFAESLPHFFPGLEQILVFVTPTVCQHPNLAELRSRLGAILTPVEIPEGHSEAALWEILNILTGRVKPGDRVIFDITNSFRSLPFLVFLAAAFLRSAQNVAVEGVIYGAYEAHDADNRSPVFDLTPFIGLLDWITATNRFTEMGDGRPLADLLQQEMPPGVLMGSDQAARALGVNLRLAASAIDHISLALRVARPLEAMQASHRLVNTIQQTRDQVVLGARPFEVLVDQVTEQFGQFGLALPTEPASLQDNLGHQLGMIRWYLAREQTLQAATLAREWVVSLLAVHFGLDLLDRGDRKALEDVLNNAVELGKARARPVTIKALDQQFTGLQQAKQITQLWNQLTQVRNDLAHAGMRKDAQPAEKLKSKVADFWAALEELAAAFIK